MYIPYIHFTFKYEMKVRVIFLMFENMTQISLRENVVDFSYSFSQFKTYKWEIVRFNNNSELGKCNEVCRIRPYLKGTI